MLIFCKAANWNPVFISNMLKIIHSIKSKKFVDIYLAIFIIYNHKLSHAS